MTTFTVAIPTHNRRETALLAAQSAVRQRRRPLEVLVLCDGCTDGTSEAIAALGDPRIRAIDLPKGPGYAYAHRNVAVEVGRGDVITWLADDDLFLPDHFKRIGRVWDADAVDLVVAPAVIVHEDDRLEWIGRDWRIPEHRRVMMEQTNTSVMASVSVRRQLVADVGGWDGAVERAGDWRLWQRLLEQGARPAMTHEATVLHFRATTRQQAWSLRVRQNAHWLEALGDADRRRALRQNLRLARSGFEAALSEELLHARSAHAHESRAANERQQQLAEVVTAADDLRRELAETQAWGRAQEAAAAAALRGERAALDNVEALQAELNAVRAERASIEPALEAGQQAQATLQRIYAGGWWRLRAVVRGPLEVAAFLRRRRGRP